MTWDAEDFEQELIYIPRTNIPWNLFSPIFDKLLSSDHDRSGQELHNNRISKELKSKLSFYIDKHIPCMFYNRFTRFRPVIIYFHGNSDDIGKSFAYCSQLHQLLGFAIIAVEYPGYSIHEGNPSENAIFRDADQVLDFTVHRLGVPINEIILVGASMGSVVALYLASRNQDIGMLILISAIESLKRVIEDSLGSFLSSLAAGVLGDNKFDSISRACFITCPLLMMHGLRDDIAGLKHSYALFGRIGLLRKI